MQQDSLVFETRRWPYLLALPAMWLITFWVIVKKHVRKTIGLGNPKTNSLWFDGLGQSCQKVKEGQASWRALDEIYNYRFRKNRGLCGLISDFWEGMLNCQAVRNRFKVAKEEIRRAILEFSGQDEVRVISLAAGSAQAVIETVAELSAEGFIPKIKVMLVDVDKTALEYARKLADCYHVENSFLTTEASVACIKKISKNFQPHIVEMIGLLDYLIDEKAIKLIGKIYQSLPSNGIFLTCNICPNVERSFLRWVVNWPMVYRRLQQLSSIVVRGGFAKLRLIREPLNIHCLAVARK